MVTVRRERLFLSMLEEVELRRSPCAVFLSFPGTRAEKKGARAPEQCLQIFSFMSDFFFE